MAKSTQHNSKHKPQKPRPDFPLYAHASGKWAKTIRGKCHYFGRWEDPEGALREYLDQKDDLYAGRILGAKGGTTIREVCNMFIASKRVDLDAGRLSPRTFVEYDRTCRMVIDEFGAGRAMLDLRPTDFEKFYAMLSHKHGVATLGREVTCVRMVFKYGFESDLIERPVKFGPRFRGPSKQDRRKARAKSEQENGAKIFTAEEIRRMLDVATPALRAMILLGINGGMGNTDCSSLPISALDLKTGWLNYARSKTGIQRRIPLWPETIDALRDVLANRREAADPADANLVFLTKFGLRWVRYAFGESRRHGKTTVHGKKDYQLSKTFAQLLDTLDLRRRGIGFYVLRHSFETIAGGSRDQVAVDAVMGHSDPSMASEYRHGIDDDRLQAVVEHVHAWLFKNTTCAQDSQK